MKPLRSKPPQGGGELPEWDAFKSDEIDLLEQARTEAGLLSLDLLSGGTNTLAIIESAGTAAEFSGVQTAQPESIQDRDLQCLLGVDDGPKIMADMGIAKAARNVTC